jgi:hypothetical protein
VAVASVTALGATRGDSEGENLTITVRIHNFAQVPADTLSQAELIASRVFREAGIELAWLDCPITSAEPGQDPDCLQSSSAMLRLRILPHLAPQASDSLGKGALGFAVTVPRPEHGYLASVYYDRARQQAEKLALRTWQILGFAIAHEIGHLLLGPESHSRSGLMRGKWDKDAMSWGVRGALLLSQEEAAAIRTDVAARLSAARQSQNRRRVTAMASQK